MQRNKGAEEAFLEAAPDFDKENIIRVAYDNTMVNSIDVMTTTLTANPQVTNWIFYSCNDDGVLGAARALENSGYPPDRAWASASTAAVPATPSAAASRRRSAARCGSTPAITGRIAVELLLASIKTASRCRRRPSAIPN